MNEKTAAFLCMVILLFSSNSLYQRANALCHLSCCYLCLYFKTLQSCGFKTLPVTFLTSPSWPQGQAPIIYVLLFIFYYLCFNQWLLELSPADYGFPSYLQPWLLMCYPTLHCSWGLQRTPSWVNYYMLYIRILKLFKKGFGTEGSTVAVGLDVELCSVCW